MVKPALIAYNPTLHDGFIKVYRKYAKQVDTLYILGSDLTSDIPGVERELSTVDPKLMQKALAGLGFFKKVTVLDQATITKLPETEFVATDHFVVRTVIEKYLPKAKISWESLFLRWDMPKALSQQPVDGDYTISSEKLDQECMKMAETEAQKSPVWWRQVGAAAFKDGKLLLVGHNEALPDGFISYTEGDPRSWFEAGVRTDLTPDIHGEQALISTAAAKGISLKDASIYVTVFPCPTCANLIALSGFKKCYFRSGYSLINGQRVLKAFGVELIWVK